MKKFLCTMIVVTAAMCCGCGNNMRVSGKVTFDDGSPLTTGTVLFQGEKTTARGQLEKDGTFTLGATKENDGLPRGETYSVCIIGANEPLPTKGGMNMALPLIADKYTSFEKSGLTFVADGKTKEMNFVVERPDEKYIEKLKKNAQSGPDRKPPVSPFAKPGK
ncbi:MAG: hypothetical protein Q4G68_01230 [Planctomycetia bacterium]|nr:hypothetical protein [Planctomycetia bacterium]